MDHTQLRTTDVLCPGWNRGPAHWNLTLQFSPFHPERALSHDYCYETGLQFINLEMRIWLEVSKTSFRNADIGRKPKSLHNNKHTFDSSLGGELCASEEHRAQAPFLRDLPLPGSLKQTLGIKSTTAALLSNECR